MLLSGLVFLVEFLSSHSSSSSFECNCECAHHLERVLLEVISSQQNHLRIGRDSEIGKGVEIVGSSWISDGAWYLEGRSERDGEGVQVMLVVKGGRSRWEKWEGATGMRESQEGKVDRAAEASESEGGDFGGAQGEELKPVERSSGRGGPWRR